MNPKSSVIISAGGTGGHIYPALALAKELQQQQIHVIWLGTTQGLESRIVPAEGILLKTVSVEGVRGRGLLSLLKAPFLILKAILDCLLIYRKVKPEAVCGFGGYVTGPACVAARILGVKVVIHEQNAIAGTTNRLLARIADKVFTADRKSVV